MYGQIIKLKLQKQKKTITQYLYNMSIDLARDCVRIITFCQSDYYLPLPYKLSSPNSTILIPFHNKRSSLSLIHQNRFSRRSVSDRHL